MIPPGYAKAPSSFTASAHDERVEQHLPLVKRIARSLYAQRSFDGVPFEEYLQFGAEGLLQALGRYDPGHGAQFETYASHRIRGAILSGLEKSTEVNQQVATLRRLSKERIDSLRASDEDSALDLPVNDPQGAFDRLVNVALGLAVAFMLEDSGLYTGTEPTHWDDGAANLAYKQLQQRLLDAMATLTKQEHTVLDWHYFQQESFVDVAAHLGLTKGRISQIHRSALLKLRQAMQASRLGELLG